MSTLQSVPAIVVPGHRVASGENNNPRFPGGTLRMQAPFFRELGLDLSRFHDGTVNVSVAPAVYQVVRPCMMFPQVKWHPVEPAEDFLFFDVKVYPPGGRGTAGYIYYPSPETKPEHFQKPGVLELLLPFIYGLPLNAEF